MKRKIYDALLNWKNTERGQSCILVQGARRVGKSYIVEEFAKQEYKSFLIAKNTITSRHNISPIEVKSSRNYTLKSIQKFIAKYSEQLHVPYVLHPGDLMEKDGITYLPLYMTPFL